MQKARAAFAESSESSGGAAVAESSALRGDIQWVWGQGRAETMHPFWGVRRLTPQQLDKEIEACIRRNKTAVAGKEEIIPSFNCALEVCSHSAVTLATVGDAVVNCTKIVKAPVLINSKALAKGEELILPLAVEAKDKHQSKRTWRDVSKEEQQRAIKAKRATVHMD